MKKVILVLVLFLLCGCASFSENDITNQIDEMINNLDVREYIRTNNSATYFSYYIPSDIQEFDTSENAVYLRYEDSEIVLNLNIAGIINDKYYPENAFKEEGFYQEENIFYTKSGLLNLATNKTSNYLLKIYKDELYLIHFVCKEANIYASSNGYDLLNTIKKIFIIATSIDANEETIISTYSYKDVIDYEKKQIGLFDYVLPSSGYLNDLISSVNGEITSEDSESQTETNEEAAQEEITNESNDNQE